MALDVKKSNSSNETPNVMTVGVEKYGLNAFSVLLNKASLFYSHCALSGMYGRARAFYGREVGACSRSLRVLGMERPRRPLLLNKSLVA
jgi:hypothetical protein